jgi:hypothetical protein
MVFSEARVKRRPCTNERSAGVADKRPIRIHCWNRHKILMKLIHLAAFTFTALGTLNSSAAGLVADTWMGANNNFNAPGNWSLGTVPTSANSANFSSLTYNLSPIVGTNTTIGGMTFSSAPSYTIGTASGVTLTLDGSGTNTTLLSGGNNTETFSGTVVIQNTGGTSSTINVGNGALVFSNSSNLTIKTSVGATGNSGGGSLAINGAFTYGTAGATATFNYNKGSANAAAPQVFYYNPTSATFLGTTTITDGVNSTDSATNNNKIEIQTSIATGGLTNLIVGSGNAVKGAIYINKDAVSVGAALFMGPSTASIAGGTYTFGMDSSTKAAGSVTGKVTLYNSSGSTGTDNFDVAANNTLTISGQIVNSSASSAAGFGVTKTSAGSLILSNATGNTFANTMTISAGTVYANNTTSGSGTGSGAVVVNGTGTLAGNGNITGAGITVNGGGTLGSGAVQTAAPAITPGGLTVTNTSIAITGATSGTRTAANTANLAFDLGTGITPGSGAFTYATPNTNVTTLTLNGSTSMNFTGYTAISLVDLTGGNLQLVFNTPYLLVHDANGLDSAYQNLVIVTGKDASGNDTYALSQSGATGYVLGVNVSGVAGSTLGSAGTYDAISFNDYGSDGMTPLTAPGSTTTPYYGNPELYLTNGNLEVVPEPSTWTELLGGFLLLVVVVRRRSPSSV